MSKYVGLSGVAGFIGRVVARRLCERGDRVYAVDRLDYAADPESVAVLQRDYPEHFHLRCQDVRTLGRLPDVDAFIHLAASTHVDNSLTEGPDFADNNVGSTVRLLEMVRALSQHGMPHFIHISTDEVYGSIAEGAVTEDAPLRPTSPYAASKAAADLLVQAWGKTYNVPYTILRPTNAYGQNQHPEKLIPKCVRSLMLGRAIPIHGDGSQTRCWLNVEDLADAILLVLDKRLEGVFNVGGNTEASVLKTAVEVSYCFHDGNPPRQQQMGTGYVRPACDHRYAVDDSAIRAAGWAPRGAFWSDLPAIVESERGRFRF